MTEIILFACTFTLVFALGVQSLNVNGGPFGIISAMKFHGRMTRLRK